MEQDELVIKSCCADFYRSDIVRALLGDVLHPGGPELTHHLGELLELGETDRVLDIACGRGASAIHLASTFSCHVTGLDFSGDNIAAAVSEAESSGVAHLTAFKEGDAECLPFQGGSFDAVISECSFCTFPDKKVAASEMFRVILPGGRMGITDITLNGPLPEEMKSLLSWVACVAGAGPVDEYASIFRDAGFTHFHIEDRSEALKTMVKDIRGKMLGVEFAIGLAKYDLGNLDLNRGKELLKEVSNLVNRGIVGYSLVIARKESQHE